MVNARDGAEPSPGGASGPGRSLHTWSAPSSRTPLQNDRHLPPARARSHEDEHVFAATLHPEIPHLVCHAPIAAWRGEEHRHVGIVVRISVLEMDGQGESVIAGRQPPNLTGGLETDQAQPVEAIKVRQITNDGPVHGRHPDGARVWHPRSSSKPATSAPCTVRRPRGTGQDPDRAAWDRCGS
jgi:hypothetical protein